MVEAHRCWRPRLRAAIDREVRAADPEDRRALATFLLRAPGSFSHLAHVRVARLYAQQLPFGIALERFSGDVKRYARKHGASGKFHQTVTVGFMLVVKAALAEAPPGETFDELLLRAPHLGSSKCLGAWYSDALLSSALARNDIVLPDRAPPPPADVTGSRSRSA